MSTTTWKSYPFCWHTYAKFSTYTRQRKHYCGCPIKVCECCGNTFIDKGIQEPAFKPMPHKISIIQCVFSGFFSFGSLSILFMISILGNPIPSSAYHLFVAVPAAIWVGIILYSFHTRDDYYATILKEYRASKKRLLNKEYAAFLAKNGFKVPERFLK